MICGRVVRGVRRRRRLRRRLCRRLARRLRYVFSTMMKKREEKTPS